MAYSNINKDKVQVPRRWRLKTVILVVIALIFTFSSLRNIWKQYNSLRLADARNDLLLADIRNLEEQNKQLEEEIRYATTSAGLGRNAKKYLGMGTDNDYWLRIEREEENYGLYQESKETTELLNWQKWWLLFTN